MFKYKFKFPNEQEYIKALQLNNVCYRTFNIRISEDFGITCLVPVEVHNVMRTQIEQFIKQLKQDSSSVYIKYKTAKKLGKHFYAIYIYGSTTIETINIHKKLLQFIRGYPIFMDHIQATFLKEPDMKKIIEDLGQKHNVIAIPQRHYVSLYGTEGNNFAAEKDIISALDIEKNQRYKEFTISKKLNPKGIYKNGIESVSGSLTKHFHKETLNPFLNECTKGISTLLKKKFEVNIRYDFLKELLKIICGHGNGDVFSAIQDEIQNHIKFYSEKIQKKPPIEGEDKTCPICFCQIEVGEETVTLKKCHHEMHKGCLKMFLQFKLQLDQQLPVNCPKCNDLVSLQDILSQLEASEIKKIGGKAVNYLLSDSKSGIMCCSAPDCGRPLRKTEKFSKTFSCWKCKTHLCPKCFSYQHVNVECDSGYLDSDLLPNTKKCPACNSLIEKNGGCDHMTCTNCSIHFCRKCCKFTAKESSPIYVHMGHCEGV